VIPHVARRRTALGPEALFMGDDALGRTHRAHVYLFELFELIIFI
jgi:hypothetical protein